jgi:hypothetical protein
MTPFVWNFKGHGVVDLNVPLLNAGVGTDSRIVASATELGIFGGEEAPFIGQASIQVLNIAPGKDHALIRVNILWGSDINVRINGLII